MARELGQILSELNQVYQPQRDVYNNQMSQLDPQQQAEQQGLNAAKTDAFQGITDQANRRGLFYSGMPIAEEQKYTGASYLPAVANLHAKYAQQRFSLQDALAKSTTDQQLKGEDIYQTELNRDAATAAANARASAAAAGAPGIDFSGLGAALNPGDAGAASATAAKGANGRYAFTNAGGQSISAAAYAAQKGIPIRDLLTEMANSGDAGARTALTFVGHDFGYDPRKITNQSMANLYNSLVWGTNLSQASVYSPKAAVVPGGYGSGALLRPTQQTVGHLNYAR